jgi:hypothetical protein
MERILLAVVWSDSGSIQSDQPGSAVAENHPCHCLFFLLIYFAVEDEQTTVSATFAAESKEN